MKLGLFLETIPGIQGIEVYNRDEELIYKGTSDDCNINPEKIIFTFFAVQDGSIYVYLDFDEEV